MLPAGARNGPDLSWVFPVCAWLRNAGAGYQTFVSESRGRILRKGASTARENPGCWPFAGSAINFDFVDDPVQGSLGRREVCDGV